MSAASKVEAGLSAGVTVTLYVIAIIMVVLPALLSQAGSIGFSAISLNIFIFSLTLYAISRRKYLVAFFNSVCLFFITYPFLLQSAAGIDLSGHGYVRPLSWTTAITYSLYLGILTSVAMLGNKNKSDLYTQYGTTSQKTSIGYAFVILAAFIYIFGTDPVFSTRFDMFMDSQTTGADSTFGQILFVQNVIKVTPFWLAYMAVVRSRRRAERSPFSVSFFVCMGVGMFLCNPVNTARYISLTSFFLALLPVISYYGKIRWLHVAFPAAMIIVLPFTSYIRYGFENLTWEGVVSTFYSLEFSALQVLNDGFAYMEFFEWGYGTHIITAFFIFIPSAMWPGKNEGTGLMIGETALYPISNIGVPPLFDAYLDFGVAGVVVMAIAVGYVFRNLSIWSNEGSEAGHARADLSALLVALMPIFARGDFSAFAIAFYGFGLSYVLARLLVWVGKERSARVGASLTRRKALGQFKLDPSARAQ